MMPTMFMPLYFLLYLMIFIELFIYFEVLIIFAGCRAPLYALMPFAAEIDADCRLSPPSSSPLFRCRRHFRHTLRRRVSLLPQAR